MIPLKEENAERIKRWMARFWRTQGVVEMEGYVNPYQRCRVGDSWFQPLPRRHYGQVASSYHFDNEAAALERAIELATAMLRSLNLQQKQVAARLAEMEERLQSAKTGDGGQCDQV